MDGVYGRLFTSNVNGNKIFFPAAGRFDGESLGYRGLYGLYWSSTYISELNAGYLNFGSSDVIPQGSNGRRFGFSVRAVIQP